ncbi:hypothetical protein GDO78_006102 [Eleutherodactylus coqui]|uniref:Uncharacterized protein n=1 Tax=Eleutherodactylus coqui TaxID=57060 RepID=A0A8J6FNH5_ELECQ|nr:hypothetical protein GDO78_006102 [Eleutherodactylus coqui]
MSTSAQREHSKGQAVSRKESAIPQSVAMSQGRGNMDFVHVITHTLIREHIVISGQSKKTSTYLSKHFSTPFNPADATVIADHGI